MAVSALESKSRWGEDRNLFMLSTSYISDHADNTFYHSEISYDQFRETQTLITSSLYWSCCNYSPILCPPALSFSASCSGALTWELDYEECTFSTSTTFGASWPSASMIPFMVMTIRCIRGRVLHVVGLVTVHFWLSLWTICYSRSINLVQGSL